MTGQSISQLRVVLSSETHSDYKVKQPQIQLHDFRIVTQVVFEGAKIDRSIGHAWVALAIDLAVNRQNALPQAVSLICHATRRGHAAGDPLWLPRPNYTSSRARRGAGHAQA